jgi:hypothetical protein
LGYHDIEKPLRNKGFGVLKESGGLGVSRLRTWFDYFAIVGVPQDTWSFHPFLVSPFSALVVHSTRKIVDLPEPEDDEHPIVLAIRWQEFLKENPLLTPRSIAAERGLSAGRVRQILRLATLAPEIRETLSAGDKGLIRRVSEKKLRPLIPLKPSEQLSEFRRLLGQ